MRRRAAPRSTDPDAVEVANDARLFSLDVDLHGLTAEQSIYDRTVVNEPVDREGRHE